MIMSTTMSILPAAVAATSKVTVMPAVPSLIQQIVRSGPSLSTILPPAVALLRGGSTTTGTASTSLDLNRVRIRLEGLSSYGVVTALMMNASLRLFASTPKKLKDGDKVDNVAKILFAILISISIMSGAYTTVVFSMLSLYSKSALGLGKDDAYVDFMAETAQIRTSAFDSFLVCLVTVTASVVLSLFLNYDEELRWYASGVALAAALFSWWQWSNILSIAGRLLFKSSG